MHRWIQLPLALAGVLVSAITFAQAQSTPQTPDGNGAVAGRVQDATTGRFLLNARVTVVGTPREAFTNPAGEFELTELPAGPATLRVTYTGHRAQTVQVTIAARVTARRDFQLRSALDTASGTEESKVVLDEFVVAARQMDNAAEIAVNEQRVAANIKSVVSTEAFGDLAQNNIGEFLKFLPGVEPEYGDNSIGGVRLRGMPAAQTNISIDGGGVSVAGSGGANRGLNFQTISLNNVSRIEVSKSVLPDQRADSLGGTVNLVSRTAFERSRPEFTYKVFAQMNSHFVDLGRTPGGAEGGDGSRRKWFPDFELNYVNPLTKNVGIAINATRNDKWTLTRRFRQDYTIANSTPEAPYLQVFNLLNYPSFEERSTAGAKIDWRFAPRDVLSLTANTNYYFSNFEQHNFQFQANTLGALVNGVRPPANGSAGPTFMQGRAGQATVQQWNVTRYGAQANNVLRLNWRHTGPVWDFDLAGGGNKSRLWYRSMKYGQLDQPRVQLVGVTLRFDDIGRYGPGRITTTDAAGAPVDVYSLNNYSRINSFQPTFDRDMHVNARDFSLNAKRKFNEAPAPISVKTGGAFRSDSRDRWLTSFDPLYVGRDRVANNADDAVSALPSGTLLDASGFSHYSMIGGYRSPEWLSSRKMFNLLRERPDLWDYPVARQASDYNQYADSAEELSEKVSSAYVMGDTSLLRGRLRLVGGVRAERWEFEGRGQLIDNTRQYQKDAGGNLVDGNPNQAGLQLVPLTTDPLEVAKLTHIRLGNHMARSRNDYFPSLGGTFLFSETLYFRFGYAKTTGRPNFGDLIPGLNVSRVTNAAEGATGAALGTIRAKNPDLKPWLADNYDLSLEYYSPRGDKYTVGVFRKDITDFFSSVGTTATVEYLERVGLSEEFVNYRVETPGNVTGTTRMTGIEVSAEHRWTRWLSTFANASVNRNLGPAEADFRGYVRKRINTGFQITRGRASALVKLYHIGRVVIGSNTTLGPNGWIYILPRSRVDVNLEYRLTKHATLFGAANNIFNDTDRQEFYTPVTPAYARFYQNNENGVLFQIGMKGAF